MNNNKEKLEIPSIPALKEELMREKVKREFRRAILNMAGILIVAAALTALMATRIFVLVQINGSSMKPTLNEDEVIILRQTKAVEKGDIVGFYYGGKILLKRVMAGAGDEVDIDREGNVSVNGERLGESYLKEKRLGKCDLEFPYEVPEGAIFVLGDNRAISMDSRIKSIGCVESDQIVGKVVFRMWPMARMGIMH
ncbi:MAG: signal peptidase I [Dorea sp.]|nr:signal peptidase I [Dorea sp.]